MSEKHWLELAFGVWRRPSPPGWPCAARWRQAFVVTGALGTWRGFRCGIGPHGERGLVVRLRQAKGPVPPVLRRSPAVGLRGEANSLSMIGYSLWTNWTTLYLVAHGLTAGQAAWYAWIPPFRRPAGRVRRRMGVAALHRARPWRLSRRGSVYVWGRRWWLSQPPPFPPRPLRPGPPLEFL